MKALLKIEVKFYNTSQKILEIVNRINKVAPGSSNLKQLVIVNIIAYVYEEDAGERRPPRQNHHEEPIQIQVYLEQNRNALMKERPVGFSKATLDQRVGSIRQHQPRRDSSHDFQQNPLENIYLKWPFTST